MNEPKLPFILTRMPAPWTMSEYYVDAINSRVYVITDCPPPLSWEPVTCVSAHSFPGRLPLSIRWYDASTDILYLYRRNDSGNFVWDTHKDASIKLPDWYRLTIFREIMGYEVQETSQVSGHPSTKG
jgi:hypothetical protein